MSLQLCVDADGNVHNQLTYFRFGVDLGVKKLETALSTFSMELLILLVAFLIVRGVLYHVSLSDHP